MYDRWVDGRELTFRFHPDLFKENLLVQDLETKSKWSQLKEAAVSGPLKGAELNALPTVQTTWRNWRRLHPQTLVLSSRLGLSDRSFKYQTHSGGREIIRGVSARDVVLGLNHAGVQKAYPFSQLKKTEGPIEDKLEGKTIRIHFDRDANSAYATDSGGQPIPAVTLYWKSWVSFNPSTRVFVASH